MTVASCTLAGPPLSWQPEVVQEEELPPGAAIQNPVDGPAA